LQGGNPIAGGASIAVPYLTRPLRRRTGSSIDATFEGQNR